jgi:hypothetical protein
VPPTWAAEIFSEAGLGLENAESTWQCGPEAPIYLPAKDAGSLTMFLPASRKHDRDVVFTALSSAPLLDTVLDDAALALVA